MGEELGPEGRMDPEHLKDAAQRRDNAQRNWASRSGYPVLLSKIQKWTSCPHDDEEAQRAYYEKEGTDELTTTDVFQGVTKVELSAPPDEELPPPIVFLGDRKKDIEGTAPVVVYPDQHLGAGSVGARFQYT